MIDINGCEDVEVKVSQEKGYKKIWINVGDVCRLRISTEGAVTISVDGADKIIPR